MIEGGTVENRVNVDLVFQTLARLLGEQYGCKITVTVRPKEERNERGEKHVQKCDGVPGQREPGDGAADPALRAGADLAG